MNEDKFCTGPHCAPIYEGDKQVAVDCSNCPLCNEVDDDDDWDNE